MTRRKRRTRATPIEVIKARKTAIEVPPPEGIELRALDDGFAFPLGQRAQMTDALFFCAAPQCPGYDYRASERAHPTNSCGSDLNTADGRVLRMTDVMDQGVSIDASTSGDEIAILTEDMPQLADDSPAANGEVLEEVLEEIPAEPDTATNRMRPPTSAPPAAIDGDVSDEPLLPSPLDSMMPRTVEDNEDLEHFLVENSDAPLARVPRVGTCWIEVTRKTEVRCYEVVGVNAAQGYALCEFHAVTTRSKQECLICLPHFINGDLVPFLTPPTFIQYSIRKARDVMSVAPIIADPESRGLFPCPTLLTYAPSVATLWKNQAGDHYLVESVDEQLYLDRENSVPRVTVRAWNSNFVARNSSTSAHVLQLGLHEFLDGSLEFLGNYVQPAESPEEAEPIEEHAPERARIDFGAVEEHQVSVFELIQEISDELDVAYTHVTRLVDSALSTVLAALRMKGVIATSPAMAAVQAFISQPGFIESVRTMFWRTTSADEAPDLRQIVDYINRELEPRIDRLYAHQTDQSMLETLAAVLARLDALEAITPAQSDEPRAAKRGPKPKAAKRGPKPKGSFAKRSDEPKAAKRGPGRPKPKGSFAKRSDEPKAAKRGPGRPKPKGSFGKR